MDKVPSVAVAVIALTVVAGAVLATDTGGLSGNSDPKADTTTPGRDTNGGGSTATQPAPSSSDTPSETTHVADETGLAVAESGLTCLDETTASRSGWVHISGSGADAAVSFDITVASDASQNVDLRLSNLGTGDYALRIETDGSATTSNNSDCQSVVRYQGGGRVPDIKTLRVTVNGETIQTIEKRDSFAELRELPEPITAENNSTA